MNNTNWFQFPLYFGVLLLLVKPLGAYMAHVYQGERTFLDPVIRPVERFFYRFSGVKSEEEMNWKRYASTVLLFNLVGFLFVYLLLRVQHSFAFESTRIRKPDTRSCIQHRGQFCFEYKLAKLRWRNYTQ